jgi:TRAP-type C4-dicarboxylate transport system permease small subunit
MSKKGRQRKLGFAFVTLPHWIIGTLMLAGVAVNFANVVSRYLFGQPFFWAEEVLVFLNVWGVFIAVAAIAYNGEHLNMDLLSSRLRGRSRTANNAFITLVLLACCGLTVLESARVVSMFAATGEVSVAAGVPMAIPYSALLVGFTLMALGAIVRIRSYITGKF